jgi:hypothetical protein
MSDQQVDWSQRIVEMLAVILLGLTTIGTAWCTYQGSRWNADSAELTQSATDHHVEGARLFGSAVQQVSYDSTMIAMYAQARSQQNDSLAQFYRASLIRPDFLPVLDRWEAEVDAGRTPVTLVEDPDYVNDQLAAYRTSVSAAEAASRSAQQAGENASGYFVTTILLAVALFFAGVVTSFRYRPAQVVILLAAFGAVAAAAIRLAELPLA